MIKLDVGNFDKQARTAERKVASAGAETIRSVARKLLSEFRRDVKTSGTGSPIASGRYVASFRLGINGIDTSSAPADPTYVYDRDNLAPRTIRNDAISSVAAKLRTFKLGDDIFISNSVPYVRRIEVGKHSWQAPDGVFRPTVAKVMVQFKNVSVGVRGV